MTHAKKLTVRVPPDRNVRLPEDIPEGPAEMLYASPSTDGAAPSPTGVRPGEGLFAGFAPPDDAALFEPLPHEIQRYFEGESDPEDGLD